MLHVLDIILLMITVGGVAVAIASIVFVVVDHYRKRR
jgi:hypothetical protein